MKKTYQPTKADLREILNTCSSYIDSSDEESLQDYFLNLVQTSLFADAVGKVVRCSAREVEVTTEY